MTSATKIGMMIYLVFVHIWSTGCRKYKNLGVWFGDKFHEIYAKTNYFIIVRRRQ